MLYGKYHHNISVKFLYPDKESKNEIHQREQVVMKLAKINFNFRLYGISYSNCG